LPLSGELFTGKNGHPLESLSFVYQPAGIIVGAVNRLQFNE
jgi:hypothetical protein